MDVSHYGGHVFQAFIPWLIPWLSCVRQPGTLLFVVKIVSQANLMLVRPIFVNMENLKIDSVTDSWICAKRHHSFG